MPLILDASATSLAPEIWGVAGIVFGALLGGAAQIVTVILTHRHAVQADHLQFKRDAYFEVLKQADALVKTTRDTLQYSGDEQAVYMESLGKEGQALRLFMDARLALEMYAAPEVTLAVQRLADAVQGTRAEEFDFAPSGKAATAAYERAHDATVVAMRRDLWVDRRGLWRRTIDSVLRRPPAGHRVELRVPGGRSL